MKRYLLAWAWIIFIAWAFYSDDPTTSAPYFRDAEGPYYCHLCTQRFHEDEHTISCSTCQWSISRKDYREKLICPIDGKKAKLKNYHLDCNRCDYHLPHKMWEDSFLLVFIFGGAGAFYLLKDDFLRI